MYPFFPNILKKDTSYLKSLSPFETIWYHVPELQNWSSSSWWFFLLFPKQKEGYGPKQMMFTFASRVGKEIRVSTSPSRALNNWQPGIPLPRSVKNGTDEFWTTVVGWINDGHQVHEEIVHQPARAVLKNSGSLKAWAKNGFGGEIKINPELTYGIDAHFKGKKGEAKFTVWKVDNEPMTEPHVSDIRTKFGGTHLVAWRKFNFKGTFASPSGTEELEGIGYFQRVCMNIPMFPWKWIFTYFEDGSIFSLFGPYLGLQMFRRGNKWLPPFLERVTSSFAIPGYFYDAKTQKITSFPKSRIQAFVDRGKYPIFTVKAWNNEGDNISFIANAYGHAQFLLDRRILKRMWISRLNYNEFMYKVEKLSGKIGGRVISKQTVGQGWGNHEYTWGFSL